MGETVVCIISLETMKIVALTLLVLTLAVAVPAEEGKKRSAEQLLTRVMRNDFLIRALRSPSTRPSVILLSVSQIESTVKVSMLDLKNSLSGHAPFFRAKFEIVYLLKTAQRSKKGMGYATPKENINKI